MVYKTFTLTREKTFDAQLASKLASTCMNCNSRVEMFIGQNAVNPTSVFEIMKRPVIFDTKASITCDGETEKEDLESILSCLASLL
ncbi:MAG: hypothetical protein E7253_02350 [Lachnospiraceae bacterium]|nr:hypothetical protein [Lachnospiraceae bacterium]